MPVSMAQTYAMLMVHLATWNMSHVIVIVRVHMWHATRGGPLDVFGNHLLDHNLLIHNFDFW